MIRKIKRNKRIFYLVAFLFIIIGFSLPFAKYMIHYKINKIERKSIDNFFDNNFPIEEKNHINEESNTSVSKENSNNEYDYIAILEITSISLKRGLVDKNSIYNNVNYNIQILKESDMPNVINGNVILAGHSGSGRLSFFKNLYKIKKEDLIYIYFENDKYIYKVTDLYLEDKDGDIIIHKNNNISTLTLTTCKKNKQLVVISELIGNEKY